MQSAKEHFHFALHKPCGYSCTHDVRESPIVDELLPPPLRELGLRLVGRLDRDTSGLLVLTTDGHLIQRLIQPESKIEKQYRVGYRGVLPDDAVTRCALGMEIEGFPAPSRPAQLSLQSPSEPRSATSDGKVGMATLVLHEGRRHQVRRMFRAMRTRVVTLHRERIGSYVLPPSLGVGELVALDASMLEFLRASP